jgi:hypothetical protein
MAVMKTNKWLTSVIFFLGITASFQGISAQDQHSGKSIYPLRPNDPEAVYFTRENFNVAADGLGDDAAALQAAIDLVLKQSHGGIVFIPEGTYRLGKTVYLWSGIRLIGYGANRPIFKLGDNTPGYQDGEAKYIIHFAHGPGSTFGSHIQPGTWHTAEFIDGTWSTFYSGIDNINFEIGDGNPAAIAVRYHVAQVCALENIDFNIGNGRGGVEEMGNIIEHCTFRGGEFGIKTNPSPPDWQCMVLDCSFEGQRMASMITQNARMLVIRGRFKNAPIGILLPDRDKLYVKDTWFENISNSAMVINNFVPPDLQINLDNLKFSNVPYIVRFSGRTQGWSRDEVKMDFEAPSPVYTVKSFSHGLHLEISDGVEVPVDFTTKNEQFPLETLGEFTPYDMPDLPPQKTWVNISDLGAKGDGITDCTAVFEKAIASYDAIYIPMGKYVISRTLTMRDQTTFIGFHPSLTQLVLLNETPGFMDPMNCKPLIVAPKDGSNGITGVGFDLGINPGVIGIKWMAGAHSYINDGLFNGRGSSSLFGKGQTHTIWITDGGGGIFKNIWINDRKTKLAFYVSDTKTPGKIYEISVEHHKDVEVRLENAENWSFYALQLEEDRGSEKTLGIYIADCRNILFANLICHRTTGVWEPYHTGIQIRNTRDLTIRGIDMRGGVFPFENTLFDEITGAVVRQGIFTKLVIK